MPISRSEFEQGALEPELGRFLIQLFDSSPEVAYSLDEVQAELSNLGLNISLNELEAQLRTLEERRWIESRTLEGRTYYMRRRIGFRPM